VRRYSEAKGQRVYGPLRRCWPGLRVETGGVTALLGERRGKTTTLRALSASFAVRRDPCSGKADRRGIDQDIARSASLMFPTGGAHS